MTDTDNIPKSNTIPQKKKHAGGRPIKFSAAQQATFFELFRHGFSRKTACEEVGITYQTFFLWMKKGEEQKELPKEKRTEHYDFYIDFLNVEADKKLQKMNYNNSSDRSNFDDSGNILNTGRSKPVNGAPRKKQISSLKKPQNVLKEQGSIFQSLDVRVLTPDNVFDKTVRKNPCIAGIIFPTDKQVKFLQIGNKGVKTPNKKTEIFFRGAGWSGKTTALLLAALQYILVPDYQALLLRAHSRDILLSNLMMKMIGPLSKFIEVISENEFEIWKFPSGSTITFGHVNEQFDKSNYDDLRFHFIGYDELTHFEESDYLYLFDRVHVSPSNKIPLRIYSTGNPDGPYPAWVKERFINCPETEMEPLNRFLLRASIEDNPYEGRGWVEKRVNNLKFEMQERILNDNWDI